MTQRMEWFQINPVKNGLVRSGNKCCLKMKSVQYIKLRLIYTLCKNLVVIKISQGFVNLDSLPLALQTKNSLGN